MPGVDEAAERVTLLDVRYHNVSRAEAVRRIETFIAERTPRMVCTPNADHILLAREDPEFRAILSQADLVVADGMAVVYASRMLGAPLTENVGGRLIVDEIAARAVQKGYRLFLLGGVEQESAAAAASKLRIDHPGLPPVAVFAPPVAASFDEAQTEAMIAAVRAARPDILFMAVGTPKQEKWIARNLLRLGVPVSIGVGAAVDMLAGRVRQPPGWMTDVGLEWVFRLWQDPARLWRRYLVRGPRFLGLVVRAWMAGR